MNEPQLSAETREDILDLVDPKVPYSHFVRVLEKYTQEVIATALEEQKAEIVAKLTHELVREDGDFTDGEIEDWETVTLIEVHTAIQSLLKGEV